MPTWSRLEIHVPSVRPRTRTLQTQMSLWVKSSCKANLNKKVKHREKFRPFAPVVTLENAEEWFELNGQESPFMLYSVLCKQPEKIPSGVHIDNTSRVQTVTEESNGRFYSLVKAFGEKTGVPIIINTSFNDQGEPIVESPEDAIACFIKTDIDVLVLENYLIEKKPT